MRAIFLLISAAVVAMAQSFDSNTNSSSDDTASTYFLCNGSISEANASGIVTHSWQDIKNTGYWSGAPDHSWAITVTGGNGQELERRFWYDTAGVNYADDVGIDTDVCAFPNFYLPLNANRLGQDDPGDCSTVFSQRCIDSVTAMASESALKWTTYSSPPPLLRTFKLSPPFWRVRCPGCSRFPPPPPEPAWGRWLPFPARGWPFPPWPPWPGWPSRSLGCASRSFG